MMAREFRNALVVAGCGTKASAEARRIRDEVAACFDDAVDEIVDRDLRRDQGGCGG